MFLGAVRTVHEGLATQINNIQESGGTPKEAFEMIKRKIEGKDRGLTFFALWKDLHELSHDPIADPNYVDFLTKANDLYMRLLGMQESEHLLRVEKGEMRQSTLEALKDTEGRCTVSIKGQ